MKGFRTYQKTGPDGITRTYQESVKEKTFNIKMDLTSEEKERPTIRCRTCDYYKVCTSVRNMNESIERHKNKCKNADIIVLQPELKNKVEEEVIEGK